MVGGLRFYDRVEIKTILDYLRVINQPDNNDALARIINTPSRRIGDTTIKSLLEEADLAKTTLWTLMLGIVRGTRKPTTKIQKQADQGLAKLVDLVLSARKKLSGPPKERITTVKLIELVIDKTGYEQWLVDHQQDVHKARWDNVQELITQANDFQNLLSTGYEDEALPEVDGVEQAEDEDHLSRFLANVALASEVKTDDAEGPATAQVTISTIHAAKGLEWPVVFIPATYQGSIPHSRAEDTDEERRLLYVAMTRAKALLYMSYPLQNSQSESTTLSPFLAPPGLAPLIDMKGPSLGSSTVQSISHILRRPCPSLASIAESRSLLRSVEDDLFPIDGEDENENPEARWKYEYTAGNSSHELGQQASKRRRVELGRSVSNLEGVSERNWKLSHATTLDQASSFTGASVTTKAGFVNVRDNLEVLQEQSVNVAASTTERSDSRSTSVTQKPVTKKKVKGLEGQGTLFGFLGKPEPQEECPLPIQSYTAAKESKTDFHAPVMPSSFNRPRPVPAQNALPSIDPALANRRVGPSAGSRPRQVCTYLFQGGICVSGSICLILKMMDYSGDGSSDPIMLTSMTSCR
jgi:DNA helicase-2/ATP-dependent DNA helicase PcrA